MNCLYAQKQSKPLGYDIIESNYYLFKTQGIYAYTYIDTFFTS